VILDELSVLGVPEKVHMSEFVYTSEQELVIMRHVGIQEFTCFTHFCPFLPESPFLGL